jgi:uncharacterized membrane protein
VYTILGGDGKEYGPATADQIRAWIAGGRADLNTRAKAAGTDEWKTLGEFPEFLAGEPQQEPPRIHLDSADAAFLADALVARAPRLDVISCYERSWRLLLTKFWPLLGAELLVMVVYCVSSVVPYLRMATQFALAGVFMGGLQYYYLKTMRGRQATLRDAFSGFGPAMFPLVMITMVSVLLLLPCLVLYKEGHLWLAVLLAVPGVYLSFAYQFACAVAIDRGFNFWAALEVSRRTITAQWWRILMLNLLALPFIVAGVICLVVGLFPAMVLIQGATMYAYEDLCGRNATSAQP